MTASEILAKASNLDASDIFIVVGQPVSFKISGQINVMDDHKLMPNDTWGFVKDIYELAHERDLRRTENGDDDFSFALPGIARFRASVYKQRGSLAAVVRIVSFELPDPAKLGIPENILDLSNKTKGLVLVTGTAGSGKSTTLACIINKINESKSAHIITLEDPLEYLHRHKKSIVSQREINTDTSSYVASLRASLRQAPDVILLGEMRDYETISVAMTAAETGHLVFSSLHTVGAADSIDRIIDAFPSHQQNQIRIQLARILQAVVSQQLIPREKGGEIPVFEIMFANTAIKNMIREGKTHQIENAISSASNDGMQTMDNALLQLVLNKSITTKTAITYAQNPELLTRKIESTL